MDILLCIIIIYYSFVLLFICCMCVLHKEDVYNNCIYYNNLCLDCIIKIYKYILQCCRYVYDHIITCICNYKRKGSKTVNVYYNMDNNFYNNQL